jgi:hypothetical protein
MVGYGFFDGWHSENVRRCEVLAQGQRRIDTGLCSIRQMIERYRTFILPSIAISLAVLMQSIRKDEGSAVILRGPERADNCNDLQSKTSEPAINAIF